MLNSLILGVVAFSGLTINPPIIETVPQATKVAVLNFGAPEVWSDAGSRMLGLGIRACDFKAVIPKLESEGVEVVILRMNCDGGDDSAIPEIMTTLQDWYKPRFRTVAWIQNAIYVGIIPAIALEERYFAPNGSMGSTTCIGWGACLNPTSNLEQRLRWAQSAAAAGKSDPVLVRSMFLQVPASMTFDPKTGRTRWFEDETTGALLVNPRNQILSLGAKFAEEIRFSRGSAATPEDLVKKMGIEKVEWTGKSAAKAIDDRLRVAERLHLDIATRKSRVAALLEEIAAEKAPDRQRSLVDRATADVQHIRQTLTDEPVLARILCLDDEWYRVTESVLRPATNPSSAHEPMPPRPSPPPGP